jgi:hypothetical protein
VTDDTLENEILKRGLEDIIQLAEVIGVAHGILRIEIGPTMFDAVAECFHSLLSRNLAVVGDLGHSGSPLTVVPWVGDTDAIVNRVIDDWKALQRDPGLSEICWLELTEEGRRLGKELVSTD